MKFHLSLLIAFFLIYLVSGAQDLSSRIITVDSLIDQARYADALLYMDELEKSTNALHTLGILQNKRAEILIIQEVLLTSTRAAMIWQLKISPRD